MVKTARDGAGPVSALGTAVSGVDLTCGEHLRVPFAPEDGVTSVLPQLRAVLSLWLFMPFKTSWLKCWEAVHVVSAAPYWPHLQVFVDEGL